MQRQSLGSPLSKLHQAHGGDDSLDDKRSSKDILAFSASSSSPDFDDDSKATKPHRLSSPPPTSPDKVIHVIPILTVLCFLILFLFSHTPSPSDLAQFNGFTRLPSAKRIDSADDEVGVGVGVKRFIDISKSDVLAIRSLREVGSETRRLAPRSRSHRKIADF
ncbi:PREDICTED: uncharacterized protein LOC101299587 [Fragaria vesca subsp. vesca]|uniref:uncharacterized protein LOC101299587 n=1 Tax=Fragaria vesca subsp. vesca TaxID=101020 RepID=UPI0002C2EFF3|nr:PREDICTED: uncharacterized protein LOC101299587 [Fragaria vesca subsp. vesca]